MTHKFITRLTGALLAGAFLILGVEYAGAQALQWAYSLVNNVGTATYPGNVVIGGTCVIGNPPVSCSQPSGAAGGDLSGTYPNPTVAKVNGTIYSANPSTNTVPVVTGTNTTTYEAVPNAALANSSTTVNGTTCTLGASCTVSAAANLSVGTTSITGGTNTYLEYNNNGILGEYQSVPAANGGTGLTSPGSSGNVLTSNGAGAWTSATPATPGTTFKTSGAWSSQATGDILLTSYTACRGIIIYLYGVLPVTTNTDLQMLVSANGGSSYDNGASNYQYALSRPLATGSFAMIQSNAATNILVATGIDNTAGGGVDAIITMMNQNDATKRTKFNLASSYLGGTGNYFGADGGAERTANQITNALRFQFSSGNISTGGYAVDCVN